MNPADGQRDSTSTGSGPRRRVPAGYILGGAALVALLLAVALLYGGWRLGDPPGAPLAVDRFMHIHGLAIPGWAPDAVYVATHQGLIRIDADGSWWYISEQRHDFMGFAAHSHEEDILYSSGHPALGSSVQNPVGLMISRDGGLTWTVEAMEGQVDFHAMAVAPSDGDVLYGWNVFGEVGFYRSGDGGTSWQLQAAEPLHEAGGALSLAVHPGSAQHVLAGTAAGLLASPDGGNSWSLLWEEGAATAVAVGPQAPHPIYLFAYFVETGSGVLLVSADGGTTWEATALELDEEIVYHIAVHPLDEAILWVGAMGEAGESLWQSTDGGTTWVPRAQGGVPSSE